MNFELECALKKVKDEVETLSFERNVLYAALSEIAEMRIETPADQTEVIRIARKAINDCD